MRFSTSIIAVSAVALVQATAIPKATQTFSLALDAPEGFYVHSIGSNGKPENEHISSSASAPNTKQRREDQGAVYCKNQYSVNYSDSIAAQQGLEAQFQSGGSFDGPSVSFKSGSAVAYGCNYGNGQTVSGSWLAAQFAQISQTCGSSSGGWIAYPDWKASYGIDNSGVSFC